MGVASERGISPNPTRPLSEDEVLFTLMYTWCKEDEARLNPQYDASTEEHLQGIPKQPDNWSEGSFVQKMKTEFGSRGSVTMPEVALVTFARQKYDKTGNF